MARNPLVFCCTYLAPASLDRSPLAAGNRRSMCVGECAASKPGSRNRLSGTTLEAPPRRLTWACQPPGQHAPRSADRVPCPTGDCKPRRRLGRTRCLPSGCCCSGCAVDEHDKEDEGWLCWLCWHRQPGEVGGCHQPCCRPSSDPSSCRESIHVL